MSSADETRPSGVWRPVTPSDTVDIVPPAGYEGKPVRALNVETGGTITMKDQTGYDAVGFPLIAGYNPVGPRRIFATGITGVTNIWALF
jgi:hypothetical protein